MRNDLLERIVAATDEDFGSLQVRAVERREKDLLVYLTVQTDEDPELPRNVRITCLSYKETNLAPRYYETLHLSDDHVLLWHYNLPRVVTSFRGHVEEPLAVVGALYERHLELVGRWIPIMKYFNVAPSLSELIRGGFGMLAEGPEPLVLAYEEVLASYGVSVAHHQSAPPQNKTLSALIFDDSYVIAERFTAEPFQ